MHGYIPLRHDHFQRREDCREQHNLHCGTRRNRSCSSGLVGPTLEKLCRARRALRRHGTAVRLLFGGAGWSVGSSRAALGRDFNSRSFVRCQLRAGLPSATPIENKDRGLPEV